MEARFIDRPNRFICRVEYKGAVINTHLPDPGRLKELLLPGIKVLIKKEQGKNRRTNYSTQAVFNNNVLVSLNTLMPNKLVSNLLVEKKMPFLRNWNIFKSEVKYDNHRFDFQLQKNNEVLVLEVKSVNFVKDSVAMFPDAITVRGMNHVEYLGKLAQSGLRAVLLFVVQRSDSKLFMPYWERDPKFCNALYNSWLNGLEVRVIHYSMSKNEYYYKGELPYKLNP